MDLESATARAIEYLKEAGHPTSFIRLVRTDPEDGGWRLTFMDPVAIIPPRYYQLRIDPHGKILGLQPVRELE